MVILIVLHSIVNAAPTPIARDQVTFDSVLPCISFQNVMPLYIIGVLAGVLL
jgi:hypothetical protein